MSQSLTLIVLFHVVVFTALIIDFKFSGKSESAPSIKSALLWTIFWMMLSIVFGGVIYLLEGINSMIDFLAAYALEMSLSMDNLFVFIIIFDAFLLSPKAEHRALFWGVCMSIFLRLSFILIGIPLFNSFSWLFYIFGVLLIFTGIKMFSSQKDIDVEKELSIIKYAKKVLPIGQFDGIKIIKLRPNFELTPLFLVILVIAWTDVIFAIDSIPAVFSITKSPFIAYTSNVFAVLGLRSLFFVLRSFKDRFQYIKPSVAFITIFVGIKMVLFDIYHIPQSVSLGVICMIFLGGLLASLISPSIRNLK